MTDLQAALCEVASAMEACDLPYVLIGGLAVALSGEPRSTLDVDISVWAEPDRIASAAHCLSLKLKPMLSDSSALIRDRRVLPLLTSNGVRVDVVFAAIDLEREIIRRGVIRRVGFRTARVASVEDLILMKLISEREKDLTDARALLRRFRNSLDRDYLRPKLQDLAEGLERPRILEEFDRDA